jgi:hypothetical protein
MKRIIRLTENDLHRIITRTLNESYGDNGEYEGTGRDEIYNSVKALQQDITGMITAIEKMDGRQLMGCYQGLVNAVSQIKPILDNAIQKW